MSVSKLEKPLVSHNFGGRDASVYSITYHPAGNSLVAAAEKIAVHDGNTLAFCFELPIEAPKFSKSAAGFNNDGTQFLVHDVRAKQIVVFDCSGGCCSSSSPWKELTRFACEHAKGSGFLL